MRAENLDVVAAILDQATTPLTTKEITAQAGLSTHTVTIALAELGAVSNSRWPKGWTAAIDRDTQVSIAPEGVPTVAVELRPRDSSMSWVARWAGAKATFTNQIDALSITEKSDPKVLAGSFAAAASALATIGAAIQNVQDDPDWYAKLREHDS